MVRAYQKGVKVQLSPHFSSLAFDCRCSRPGCITTFIADELIQALETLWVKAGPLSLDRGYSCPEHNAEVGGLKDSQHLRGKAADVKSKASLLVREVAQLAETVPAFFNGGIGRYPTFTHCDTRGYRARWVMATKTSC